VLLINLDKWRAEFVTQRALIYLEKAADWLRWHDQEALNVVFAGAWLHLDARWNLTMRHLMKNVPVTYQTPCIIHYHSAEKPWHAGYPFALADVFFDYLDRTAWSGWRPEYRPFARVRRFVKRLVKALHKRQHAFRRLSNERAGRLQGAQLLASPLTLLGCPPPANVGPGEIRMFMVADDCTPMACMLIEYYLASGADRVVVAINASVADAWRSFADANAQVHLVLQGALSFDEVLRVMLHCYGQRHWCLLASPNEWLRFSYDDRLTLTALVRYLDAQHCTALLSRRVELLDANHAVVEGLTRCGAAWLPQEAVRRLPVTERDMISNHIFVADSYVVPTQLESAPHAAFRSVVSLLKYRPDMSIGPGFRSAQGIHVSDIEGVALQGQTGAPSRITWRALESAGLLRASGSLARIATLETPPP
jgi:hypothetical protein